jgi:adenylate cyclase
MAQNRKLAAILAADIVGFSRLTGVDDEGTLTRLRWLRAELLEPAIAAYLGRVFKTTGDGVLVEFRSAVDAVRCAIEIQRAMAVWDVKAPADSRLVVRIGVHVGDVIEESDGDLLGDGVNIAARLEGVADPGGVAISEDTYRHLRARPDITAVDRGHIQLKNIAEPTRVYSLVIANSSPASSANPAIPSSVKDEPSIAVLAFQNITANREQDYFADGMVEDIIAALSRFRQITVIDRNSSFALRDRTLEPQTISQQLGVRYLLGGSVRRSGQRLRFSVHLLDSNGVSLWADKFDGECDNVFALQDAIAARVAAAIEPKLVEAEIARVRRKPPGNWTAYDRYLRGAALAREFTSASTRASAEEFRAAIDLDPNFAPAYAMLALGAVASRFLFGQPLEDAELNAGRNAASRAIELGADDARALAAAATFLAFIDDALERASAIAEHAIQVNANCSDAWSVLGWARTWLGELEAAKEAFDRSMRLNPISKVDQLLVLPGYIVISFLEKRDNARLSWANRLLAIDPSNLTGLLAALDVAILAGSAEAAPIARNRLLRAHPYLTSSGVREIFRRYRKPEHKVMFDAFAERLGLPD